MLKIHFDCCGLEVDESLPFDPIDWEGISLCVLGLWCGGVVRGVRGAEFANSRYSPVISRRRGSS